MTSGFGKETYLGRQPRSHHYNFAYPGEQNEGIRSRIRQGLGGSKKIEAGVEVRGHYHIPTGKSANRGDTIFVDDNSGTGGRWKVEIYSITGFPTAEYNQFMIEQDDPEVIGSEFQGVCVDRANRVR